MTLYEKYQKNYEERIKSNKEKYSKYGFKQGTKIWFDDERFGYTIRSCNERYLVCTKPYNFKKETVIYSMVDLWEGIRGKDGYIFSPYDYFNQEDCDNYLKDITNGDVNISHRGQVELKIKKYNYNRSLENL